MDEECGGSEDVRSNREGWMDGWKRRMGGGRKEEKRMKDGIRKSRNG